MNTLTFSIIVLAASIAVSFFYGLLTKNYSTVDRLWSVLPPVYMLIWLPEYADNPRYLIVVALVLLWGIRLTTNFAIKGGYKFSIKKGFTNEDYRWAVLRAKIPNRFIFEIFNLFFISAFQLCLIFAFTLPMYYYGKFTGAILPVEWVLYAVHLLLLGGEFYADILQLRFFKRKNSSPWNEQKRYRLGFNTFGIWKISRHPNYVCEFSQWVVVYLYLVAVSRGMHVSGLGAVVLVALFAGSTNFAETITRSKYPEYAEWQKLTSVWLPVKSFVNSRRKKTFLGS